MCGASSSTGVIYHTDSVFNVCVNVSTVWLFVIGLFPDQSQHQPLDWENDEILGDVSMTWVVKLARSLSKCPVTVLVLQELQAANETLRTLQSQLELVPSPSSSTIKVLLDTKDARIATLEREIRLLEREIERVTPSLMAEPPRRQVSFLLNDVQVGKDGSVIGRL